MARGLSPLAVPVCISHNPICAGRRIRTFRTLDFESSDFTSLPTPACVPPAGLEPAPSILGSKPRDFTSLPTEVYCGPRRNRTESYLIASKECCHRIAPMCGKEKTRTSCGSVLQTVRPAPGIFPYKQKTLTIYGEGLESH